MLMQTQIRTASANQPHANAIPRPAPGRGGFGAMEAMGSQMRFGPNEEIFGEGEPAEYMYKVTKGAVRTYKILCDGRRQIGGFYLPGDIFGLEMGKEHQLSAEAINDVTVLVDRRSPLVSQAARDCDMAPELRAFTVRDLTRARA